MSQIYFAMTQSVKEYVRENKKKKRIYGRYYLYLIYWWCFKLKL